LVAAGVSPAVLSAVAFAEAEAGGILPPGPSSGFLPDLQLFQSSWTGLRFSTGRDARLYGRQDARRHHKLRRHYWT
jgi:hypothetical protein